MIKKAILKKKVLIILEKNCLDLLSTGLLGFVTSLNYSMYIVYTNYTIMLCVQVFFLYKLCISAS